MSERSSGQDNPGQSLQASNGSIGIHIHNDAVDRTDDTTIWSALPAFPRMAFRRRYDSTLTIEYVDNSCRELTGYDPAELTGNRSVSFRSIIHPSYTDLVEKTIKKAYRNRSPFQHEYRIVTANGQKKWVWEQGWWELDEHGSPVVTEGYISDITSCRSIARKDLGNASLFSTMTDSHFEGVIILDERYRLIYVNTEICRISGLPRESLIGRDFRTFLAGESREVVIDRYHRRQRGENVPTKYELSIHDASGRKKRLLIHSTRMTNLTGKAKTISQVLDITDLRRDELHETNESLRNYLIAEKMHDVIWTVDMNLKYTYLSPSVQKIFGYTTEELIRQDIKITMTPESYDLCITTLNSILSCDALKSESGHDESQRFKTLELELIRKDGSHVWAEVKTAFIRDANRLPVEILGVTRDITTRKLAEEELKTSRDFLNALVNSLDDPFSVKDESGCWIMVNDRACEFLGRPREEIIGRYDEDLFARERIAHIRETDSTAILTRTTITEEETISLTGSERTVSVKKSPYTDPVSKKTYVTCLIRDITGSKKAELALMESEEKLRRSHEELETLVEKRTEQLRISNRFLEKEIDIRNKTEAALRAREIELEDKQRSLEEMNTALRVLLKQRDSDKTDLENTIVSNLKTNVMPYIEKLKETGLKDMQKSRLSLIESHLKQITSSYIRELSSEHLGLTPAEIQVASLIKDGKGSKEIARIMNVSLNTVLTHRYHIRHKTGLKNSKVNLQSYLHTLE